MKIIKIAVKLIIIIFLIALVVFIYNRIKESYVKKLEKQCEIYLYYEDGAQTIDIRHSGKYALINIKKNKLYIIDWVNNRKLKFYEVKTKNISEEEINELLQAVKNNKDNILTPYVTTGWHVTYNGTKAVLRELPINIY